MGVESDLQLGEVGVKRAIRGETDPHNVSQECNLIKQVLTFETWKQCFDEHLNSEKNVAPYLRSKQRRKLLRCVDAVEERTLTLRDTHLTPFSPDY